MSFSTFLPYLVTMALVTYLIRAIPLILLKKKIRSRFLLSFLHYMPFAALSVMTIPAVFFATDHVITAAAGAAVALILGFFKKDLLTVAIGASSGVLIAELALRLL